MQERLGIAGAGAIACGLAVTAARGGEQLRLWARSTSSAQRARATVEKTCTKLALTVPLTLPDAVMPRASFPAPALAPSFPPIDTFSVIRYCGGLVPATASTFVTT